MPHMKQFCVFVSICFLLKAFIGLPVYAKSARTFNAGVIAQEQIFPIKVLQLGNYARCTVTSSKKENALYSACYLKQGTKANWTAESAGAQCEIKCETNRKKDGSIITHYFTIL